MRILGSAEMSTIAYKRQEISLFHEDSKAGTWVALLYGTPQSPITWLIVTSPTALTSLEILMVLRNLTTLRILTTFAFRKNEHLRGQIQDLSRKERRK